MNAVRQLSVSAALSALLAVGASAQAAAPVVDGVMGAGEWAGASHEALRGGGDLYLAQRDGVLQLALRGTRAGLASICLGNDRVVTILHSSAAVASARYERAGDQWELKSRFEFALRDSPRTGGPSAADRAAFFEKSGWVSNTSNAGNVAREFLVRLAPEFSFLAVTFLATDEPMAAATWPPTAVDDCTSVRFGQGFLPESASFKPATWHSLR